MAAAAEPPVLVAFAVLEAGVETEAEGMSVALLPEEGGVSSRLELLDRRLLDGGAGAVALTGEAGGDMACIVRAAAPEL